MPFVALDPKFSALGITTAFLAPMVLAFVNKDVIEPKVPLTLTPPFRTSQPASSQPPSASPRGS